MTAMLTKEVLGGFPVYNGRYKFCRILIFAWQHKYHWQKLLSVVFSEVTSSLHSFSKKRLSNVQVSMTAAYGSCQQKGHYRKAATNSTPKSNNCTITWPWDTPNNWGGTARCHAGMEGSRKFGEAKGEQAMLSAGSLVEGEPTVGEDG